MSFTLVPRPLRLCTCCRCGGSGCVAAAGGTAVARPVRTSRAGARPCTCTDKRHALTRAWPLVARRLPHGLCAAALSSLVCLVGLRSHTGGPAAA
jgi:hypothetical protein